MQSSCLWLIGSAVLLSACTQSQVPVSSHEPTGIANPASVFCEQQGGRSELQTDKNGNQYGICHLPNGTIIEEWEYFHQQHSQNIITYRIPLSAHL